MGTTIGVKEYAGEGAGGKHGTGVGGRAGLPGRASLGGLRPWLRLFFGISSGALAIALALALVVVAASAAAHATGSEPWAEDSAGIVAAGSFELSAAVDFAGSGESYQPLLPGGRDAEALSGQVEQDRSARAAGAATVDWTAGIADAAVPGALRPRTATPAPLQLAIGLVLLAMGFLLLLSRRGSRLLASGAADPGRIR